MRFIFFLVGFFLTAGIFAQSCTIPKDLKQESFKIIYPNKVAKKGQSYQNTIILKAPKKGRDINKVDFINCDKFVPNYGNVVQIQILSIQNLPPGLKWKSNKPNQVFKSDETGCIFLFGTPTKKGTYKLKIKTQGTGSFLGIKKKIDCWVTGYELVVK